MGKTVDDCPVIAIDSFKHMYLFPDFSMVHQEGRLLQFVKDLHSGKLHREFHQGPGKIYLLDLLLNLVDDIVHVDFRCHRSN